MSLNLAQTLLACPRVVCHVGDARYSKDHQLKQTVTPSARLLLLVQGKLAYHYPTGVHEYRSGDLWLVPQLMRRHWQVLSRSARLIWVEFVHLLPLHVNISKQAFKASELDTVMFQRIATCFEEKDASTQLESDSLLGSLLVRYALNVQLVTDNRQDGTHPAIAKVLNWLSSHMEEPVVMDQLHQQARLSANHFRKLFKQTTGMSPTQYVQMLRLRKARYLVLTTDKNIQEVGFASGYDDPQHFSRQYRQCWGVSPMMDRLSAQ
ncbi:MAG TPA: hypothetical protein DCM28_08390 [Phycisphaerales bacterium]|nr:hypothetical protein [Phycisphaerales bacterium]HCD31220.1 hypothetical protein [Phycisphaerales bacterium]|tara:strand:- start:685 stop:1476 length:792 start_codon:yes stop_codon:yes gene_type:complete